MNTQMKTQTRKSRFSHLALALALSTGTVGGMMSFAAMTEPALARGNGGGGGGAAGGGEGGGPNVRDLNVKRGFEPTRCDGSKDTANTAKCKFTTPRTARIVSIHGFANCAVVQQVRTVDGQPAEFYCVRPM